MAALDIHVFLCRKDNIGVLVHAEDGTTASIDAPDAAAISAALDEKGWSLSHILITHHHGDHTAGNLELKQKTGCRIIGPRTEAARIPGIDVEVDDGDSFTLGGHPVDVIGTPGHTMGHITYFLPKDRAAFVGDTLFVMGCGRVLEGNHEMMWHSLSRIASLPGDTRIYCGHEYTVSNARFGLSIEPDNALLRHRLEEAEQTIAQGRLTIPSRLDEELQTNVFLRPHNIGTRRRLGMGAVADWRVFGELRERKNRA
jgi:hydroxyacylglutathione hydrolase